MIILIVGYVAVAALVCWWAAIPSGRLDDLGLTSGQVIRRAVVCGILWPLLMAYVLLVVIALAVWALIRGAFEP